MESRIAFVKVAPGAWNRLAIVRRAQPETYQPARRT
jgi:hypothetical protein